MKRFNSSARLKSSTTAKYKTVKNFSSADGTNLQVHALTLQTEHHDDVSDALIPDPRERTLISQFNYLPASAHIAGCSDVAGKPLLDKAAYIARAQRVLQSKAAQKCAANCSKSLIKVCKEGVLKNACPPVACYLKD